MIRLDMNHVIPTLQILKRAYIKKKIEKSQVCTRIYVNTINITKLQNTLCLYNILYLLDTIFLTCFIFQINIISIICFN